MARSRHLHQRMGQRGITQRMVNLVSNYGVRTGDKRILDRRNLDELIHGIDRFRKDLLKLRDKGGIVVVEADETQITTYRVDSFCAPKAA